MKNDSQLKNTEIFGFEVTGNIDDEMKELFLRELKEPNSELISRREFEGFIKQAVSSLNKNIGLADFDYVLFPASQDSLIQEVLINLYSYAKPKFSTIEKFRSKVMQLTFNYDCFVREIEDAGLDTFERVSLLNRLSAISLIFDSMNYLDIVRFLANENYSSILTESIRFTNKRDIYLLDYLKAPKILIVKDASIANSTITEIIELLSLLHNENSRTIFDIRE